MDLSLALLYSHYLTTSDIQNIIVLYIMLITKNSSLSELIYTAEYTQGMIKIIVKNRLNCFLRHNIMSVCLPRSHTRISF